MTADEERLEVDPRYRAALLMAYSELCDITIDLTGLDEEQAVAWVMACLRERLPALQKWSLNRPPMTTVNETGTVENDRMRRQTTHHRKFARTRQTARKSTGGLGHHGRIRAL